MTWLVGVDVGGTFTDLYALDEADGEERVFKLPSTPDDPARAILDGLRRLCDGAAIEPAAVRRLGHGTTVGTNALIQRRGGRVGVVTTRGFRDLLEIGRQIRPKLFDLKADNPAPLAPREHRFEITERIGSRGQVLEPLADEAVAGVVAEVREAGLEACAVCLLFSFLAPDHERRIGEALRAALPDLHVSLSCEVQPEFREYERFSTTLLNAYLQPTLSRYMRRLEEGIGDVLPGAAVGINQSSGGLMSVERAQRFPIRTALSGPAAGVVGAVHVARGSGRADVITLDMGGTSADVALVRDYRAGLAFTRSVADFPVRLPMVDINTVGAGGGSVAWFDRDGLLKVGPLSAGADPGPACYGLGGDLPTVTDANVVLGRLSPAGLLGGRMAIDADAARAALAPIAGQLGFSLERTAHGILGIVTANMVRAIRAVSVERGHDPREFTLMPFGGAGALHAAMVARELGMREILVPPSPGILCAQGLVVSDLKEDFVRSARLPVEPHAVDDMRALAAELAAEAAAWFEHEGVPAADRHVSLALDMRYVGQNFELPVTLEGTAGGVAPELPDAAGLRERFAAVHETSYGYSNPDDAVEVMNLRLTARGRLGVAAAPGRTATRLDPRAAGARPVWFSPDAAVETPVYRRDELRPGQSLAGPAVVEQLDATTLVDPGCAARVDDACSLIIEVRP